MLHTFLHVSFLIISSVLFMLVALKISLNVGKNLTKYISNLSDTSDQIKFMVNSYTTLIFLLINSIMFLLYTYCFIM